MFPFLFAVLKGKYHTQLNCLHTENVLDFYETSGVLEWGERVQDVSR